ncbi:L-rhamnose-1-dehydrogenase [Orbilia oligospora]|uniref:L-rhamnose-1-dehydrogenase n=2 Tax=Orbilia oligospora TaxID=2813651 RepID=G1XEL7_ARTOA|nr:hypothetical protein AOL_s00080g252 [Orbilia oligospora ATCC 24927]EGX48623.1 hypothetical protein AOL_s00080g252 [Orbilia oligospora ATCC 24927]KAF3282415.1 L-rhamnose-1-dehydrogenase [Orbilia oligospora]KAF3316227.1 L-rhamnose-1-dehydrogenase [Orbilia oligospora]
MSSYEPQPYPTTTLLAYKAAAITGGVTGIGRAIVKELIHQGATVSVNHLDDASSKESFDSLKSEIAATLPDPTLIDTILINVPGDISQPETSTEFIAKTIEKFGKLDIFVSNAGICDFHEFLSLPPELYQKHRAVNMDGAYYSTQAAANAMKSFGKGGSIIAISSISALVGGAGQTHYTPTKAGVLSLMQSAACALGQYGIRCNAILPGVIRTRLNEEDLKDEEKRKYMEGRMALGRLGDPTDIAGPVVFLASDFSRYMTGAQLLVDGGAFVNFQ